MEIDIYTSPLCGYCTIAKKLLIKKGVDFNEFDIFKNSSLKSTMVERSNGSKTVPQIFINKQYIGGLEQLVELDQNGTLDHFIQKNDYRIT